MKKWISITLAAVMALSIAGCGKETAAPKIPPVSEQGGESVARYTYREAVAVLSGNWNPHQALSSEEAYPNQYLSRGLYSVVFNDAIHPVEGKKPFTGYTVIPEMAGDLPEDITDSFRWDHPEFEIPEGKGYVYRIPLNPQACWENGKPINGETYVQSIRRLLDPGLKNSVAADLYTGELVISGSEDYANQGQTIILSLQELQQKTGASDIRVLLEQAGQQPGWLNWQRTFGKAYDFENFPWMPGARIDPQGFCLEGEDRETETPLTLAQLWEFLSQYLISQGVSPEESESFLTAMVCTPYSYPEQMNFEGVGVIASGEYELTLVLARPLTGFHLLYNLTSSYLVEPELYDSCVKKKNGVLTCSYGTSPETTLSCGPYRLEAYESGKHMKYQRNPLWYGYSDQLHRFVDPRDDLTYRMYQADRVETYQTADAGSQKNHFLQGKLTAYGLQPQDFGEYRNSEFCYSDPSDMVLFLIMNGDLNALQHREQAEGFDPEHQDLETMTLRSFRQAIAASLDKEVFAATLSPARSGAYGLVGEPYICDPKTGTRYRDTDQAKQVLCSFYGADPENYGGDLDAAAASVRGYDPQKARVLFAQAFEEGLQAGFLTDQDGDGLSDQTVNIEYCVDTDTEFKDRVVKFLNQEVGNVTRGTPFENRIAFHKSQPYGSSWYEQFCEGRTDLVMAGWTGSILNPFALTELYTDGKSQYDGAWFDASQVPMTLELEDGETELTLSLRQWSQALNGTPVNTREGTYQFGELQAGEEQRLKILAGLEEALLETYNYIPMLQDGNMHLLSKQAAYVVEQYQPVIGRGGLAYLRFRYTDRDWAEYVQDQGGQLPY